jgi:hypothetical protein
VENLGVSIVSIIVLCIVILLAVRFVQGEVYEQSNYEEQKYTGTHTQQIARNLPENQNEVVAPANDHEIMNLENSQQTILSVRQGSQSITPVQNPLGQLTEMADKAVSDLDVKVYELNMEGRAEKTIARTRIEADKKSIYRFLLPKKNSTD